MVTFLRVFNLNSAVIRKSAIKVDQLSGSLRSMHFDDVSRQSVTDNIAAGPLAGIRILDLTRILAGPFCTMLLGDLGADVIKVEAPDCGDDSRSWGPPFFGNSHSCYNVAINRSKKSIVVNFKSEQGRRIIRKLAEKSDVLVENFVPGKLDSLGLGYEELKRTSPGLIFCSITGFGPSGPLSRTPGYDVIAAGRAGLLHITGPQDGEPCKVGVAVTDMTTGLFAHGAIMAAILERNRTGKGQKIDCNLLSTQVACLINVASNYLNAGLSARRLGTAHESIVPYEAYKTANGYVIIGIGNDRHFKEFCKRMEFEDDLPNDNRFKNNVSRVENRNELNTMLRKRFLEKSTNEWLEIFEGAQFPRGPINSIEEVFKDPQVINNKMVIEVEHPDYGKVKLIGPAVQFGNGGNYCRSPPPALGEHTEQVLANILEMDAEEIGKLKKDGVCQ